MSHFAKVENGIVTQVIVAGQEFIDTLGDKEKWIQTSYNTRGGIHYAPNSDTPDGGIALRGNYAGLGFVYDATHDVFYDPISPFPSWILNQTTWQWEPPTPIPNDGNNYNWDESTTSWVFKTKIE